MIRTSSRLAVVAVLVVGAVLGFGVPGLAHNQLIGSDPADEASLEQGPETVQLTFLASLDPDNAELAVTGPDGASAMTGEAEVDGAEVTIPVSAPLAGDYEVSYEVLSNDGHWVDGTVTFTVTVGEPAADPPPTPAGPSPLPSPEALSPAPATSPEATGADGDADGGLAWWGWLLLVAALAVVLAGGAYGAYRLSRRRAG